MVDAQGEDRPVKRIKFDPDEHPDNDFWLHKAHKRRKELERARKEADEKETG